MLSDTDVLKAVERLRDEWPDLLGSDAETVARWLATTPRDDPEAVRRTANRVLDLLRAHPQAETRVSSELGLKGGLRVLRGDYEPGPGGPDDIPPGTLVVCPVDPEHYRRPLRQKGQRCPDHGVLLVPADSFPPRE